jgi:hypothetical protein
MDPKLCCCEALERETEADFLLGGDGESIIALENEEPGALTTWNQARAQPSYLFALEDQWRKCMVTVACISR